MKKYYMIMCHRGHCGTGHSKEIKFAFEAENLLAAQDMAKKMPSEKHTRMIIYCKEISKSEYEEFRQISAYERFPQHRSDKKRRCG